MIKEIGDFPFIFIELIFAFDWKLSVEFAIFTMSHELVLGKQQASKK